jgi:hypothetical protein
MIWQPGYPTNLVNPIRDFSETKDNTTTHYTLELDMPNQEFRCHAILSEGGKTKPLDIRVEEFCREYDNKLWERISLLKEFTSEDRLDRGILARLSGASITTINDYLKGDRPILLKYAQMGLFPRWIGSIVLADFVPFHYEKPPKISGYCCVNTSVIIEALESGKYEHYDFRGTTIPPNIAERMKEEILGKKDVIGDEYSLPYVGARAAKRFGGIDGLDCIGYVRLYNTLFQKIEQRKSKKLEYTTRGLTRYVSEEVMETLLDIIPIGPASRRLGKTEAEVRTIGQAVPFDENKTWFVSRAWLATELGRYDVEVSLPQITQSTKKEAYSRMWQELALAADKKPYDKKLLEQCVALLAADLQEVLYPIGRTSGKPPNPLSILKSKMEPNKLEKIYETLQRFTRTKEGEGDVIFVLSEFRSSLMG